MRPSNDNRNQTETKMIEATLMTLGPHAGIRQHIIHAYETLRAGQITAERV